jgi:hypothetical protein
MLKCDLDYLIFRLFYAILEDFSTKTRIGYCLAARMNESSKNEITSFHRKDTTSRLYSDNMYVLIVQTHTIKNKSRDAHKYASKYYMKKHIHNERLQ